MIEPVFPIAGDATLEGWARVLDTRDQVTDEPTHRVAELTVALARKIVFPEAESAYRILSNIVYLAPAEEALTCIRNQPGRYFYPEAERAFLALLGL